MAEDIIQVSLHGRRFGLSSSGAIVTRDGSTQRTMVALTKTTANVAGSSLLDFQVLKSRTTPVTVLASSTANNYGTNILSSGTATAVDYDIAAPALGQLVEIISRASASELTLGGTSTAILIGSGTTAFLSQAAGAADAYLVLRGRSTAAYSIVSKSTDWTIS